jgi:hypothetical protein
MSIYFRLQELFRTDLGAEKLVTQAYTQMFITSWIGLKITCNVRINTV